jgi:hypothetical protein
MERFKMLNNFEKAAESFDKINDLLVSEPLSDYINKCVKEDSLFRTICSVDLDPELDREGSNALYELPINEVSIWTLPGLGYVAKDSIELGEEAPIPLFSISAARDWPYKYMTSGREDIILRAGKSVAKMITDYEDEAGFRTIIPSVTTSFGGAGVLTPRPAHLYEMPAGDPAAGYFSKELINRMIVGAARSGQTLKTLWISPEDMADMREYTDRDVDPVTRREIFQAAGLGKVWGITFRVVPQLGVRGKFNIDGHTSKGLITCNEIGRYNDYAVTHPNIRDENENLQVAGESQIYAFSADIEKIFVMPVAEKYTARWDYALTRRQRAGFYGWQRMGMGLLERNHIYMGIIDRYTP